jgi:hypothetical protein
MKTLFMNGHNIDHACTYIKPFKELYLYMGIQFHNI